MGTPKKCLRLIPPTPAGANVLSAQHAPRVCTGITPPTQCECLDPTTAPSLAPAMLTSAGKITGGNPYGFMNILTTLS